jgi:hypothetical protein
LASGFAAGILAAGAGLDALVEAVTLLADFAETAFTAAAAFTGAGLGSLDFEAAPLTGAFFPLAGTGVLTGEDFFAIGFGLVFALAFAA